MHLAHLPQVDEKAFDEATGKDFEVLLALRDKGMQQLERLKAEANLSNALDAAAVYVVPADQRAILDRHDGELEDLLGVGWHEVRVEDGESKVEIVDLRGRFERCGRSWKRRPDVGSDPEYPDLSVRDAKVMRALMNK